MVLARLREAVNSAVTGRLTPERTRSPTLVERRSVVLGADWKLLFIAARSMIGWLRWRLQREVWRRDVERLTA